MRSHTLLLAAVVALTLSAGLDARAETFYGPHLRPLNPAGAALIADSNERSATVRELVKTLDASDLIVYVRVLPTVPGGPESTISLMSMSKMARFVSVVVSADCDFERQIELLAHELEHAREIADHPAVTTDVQFQAMLAVLGWRDASRGRGYETSAATETERKVRRDVRGIGLP